MPTRREQSDTNLMTGWPATPNQELLTRALTTIMAIETYTDTVPAMVPEHQRQKHVFNVTTPYGEVVEFDAYHQLRIDTRNFTLPSQNLADAQALHDCMQAPEFTKACIDLHNSTYRGDAAFIPWLLFQAAQLGDSAHTVGLVYQKQSPDNPGNATTTMTKLSREPKWMGYNPKLEDLTGLTFRIHGSMDMPDLPSFAIGLRYSITDEGTVPHSAKFPNGEASRLRRILLHHGAEKCLWMPHIPPAIR